MRGTDYANAVGHIWAHLQSLELVLRLWLCAHHGEQVEMPDTPQEIVGETFLTNFMSLGELVTAYNSALDQPEGALRVSQEVIALRDALAHGRILSLGDAGIPFSLYRFSNPKKGRLRCTAITPLTQVTLQSQQDIVIEQVRRVRLCGKARDYFTVTIAPS